MKRFLSIAGAFAAGLVTLGASAHAQGASPNQFAADAAIGFAVPVGDYGTGLNTGIDLMGALEYHPRTTWPLYFRGELGWDHFGIDGFSANSDITRFAVDALYDVPIPNSLLQPYALAGVGLYHVSVSVDQDCGTDASGNPIFCTSSSNGSTGLGINLGGGLRYQLGRGAQAYVEVRYQLPLTGPGALSDSPFVPFQFGIRYSLR